jgi:hypothetical protein
MISTLKITYIQDGEALVVVCKSDFGDLVDPRVAFPWW